MLKHPLNLFQIKICILSQIDDHQITSPPSPQRRDVPTEESVQAIIAERITQHNIHGIFIVGGFEGFRCLAGLEKARKKFPALNIPICLLPATISNNVPGTDFSLGADTALNEITMAVDKLKQSATGTKKRVFVVETQGTRGVGGNQS